MSKMHFVLIGFWIVENVHKIFQKIEENRHVSNYDIAKELNINHKTVLDNAFA